MTANELIAALAAAVVEHGNLPVSVVGADTPAQKLWVLDQHGEEWIPTPDGSRIATEFLLEG